MRHKYAAYFEVMAMAFKQSNFGHENQRSIQIWAFGIGKGGGDGAAPKNFQFECFVPAMSKLF